MRRDSIHKQITVGRWLCSGYDEYFLFLGEHFTFVVLFFLVKWRTSIFHPPACILRIEPVLCLACFDELNPGCSHHSVTLLIQKVKAVLGFKSSITSNCYPLKRSKSAISCGTNPSFDWKDQMPNFKRIGWMGCKFGLSGRIKCTGKARGGEC